MSAVRAFAPGRVNLIGEHTDYNAGLCLPFAVARGVTVSASAPAGASAGVEALALDLGQDDRFDPDAESIPPPAGAGSPDGWRGFVRGAAAELRQAGVELRPCRLEITGDLPRGAGLGSSAALSVSLCLALCAVAGSDPPAPVELARLCSRVENDWCGARTGLLDQLASILGEPGRALRLDMETLRSEPVDLPLDGHALVTLGSGASRALAGSGYNERRRECREAADALGVNSLRHATVDDRSLSELPPVLARRVRHVVSENARVEAAVQALARGDLGELGGLLDASHRSLREDFEVSVPEVERAVNRCRAAGAIGTRIMGGGFGGSVLALFPPGTTPPREAARVEPAAGARLL